MTRFDKATAVTRVTDGHYTVELDPVFGFEEALNGGYLMAVMLRAAVDASPHQHPITTSAAFLRVGKPGMAQIQVETRKTGRTTAVSRLSLVQGDQAIIDMQVTTGTLAPDTEPDWSAPPRRQMPPVDQCLLFTPPGDRDRGFADQVDMRFDPAMMGWLDGTPSGRLEGGGYFRLADAGDDAPNDPCLIALAVDALPPIALNVGSRGWAPTVDLSWHLRALPAPGWLALYGSGRLLGQGWFDEEVEVWDSAGRLVAQSRQIARAGRVKK